MSLADSDTTGNVTCVTVTLNDIKAEAWGGIADMLGLSKGKAKAFFEHGEYASLEIEIDENLDIVGGRVLPVYR